MMWSPVRAPVSGLPWAPRRKACLTRFDSAVNIADGGAEYAAYAGTAGANSTAVVIAVVTWLGTHLGRKRTFYVAIGVSMPGYAMKWVCHDPEMPWLLLVPAPFPAFGLGGLFTLMPSMVADVVDLDEAQTFERREGMFGAVFGWVVKLGTAARLPQAAST
jgi:GPH family glycoside/pentoside/hexuronide:cation symporter